MIVPVPISTPSPLAGAQSLRQRYGRLSPLQLGIYGFVSVGSHLLLLSLLRWAWQVQIAARPAGAPTSIDFVEVDLSDRAFADQLPDESEAPLASGERLTAAQLNALIAQGQTAEQATDLETGIPNVAPVDRGGRSQPPESTPSSNTSSNNNSTETDSTNNTFSSPKASTDSADRPEDTSGIATGTDSTPSTEKTTALPNSETSTEPSTPTAPGEPTTKPTPGDNPAAPEPGNASPESSAPPDPGKSTGAEVENGSGGPLNQLPPNSNSQPVVPNQSSDQPETGIATPGAEESSSETSFGGTENNPGTGNGTAAETTADPGAGNTGSSGTPTNADVGADLAAPDAPSQPAPDTDNPSTGNSSGSSDITRLGANLVVDEVQSRTLNTQDVFDRLPRPKADPLSNRQSTGVGRCTAQLAALTPASYGQPVRLTLAVDVQGEVFSVEGAGPEAQAPVGQAIICLVEEWPFEPAQRRLKEGGVEKIEAAGAVLFVTVTISRLE